MCGIAGLVQLDGQPASRPLLESMTSTMPHRGPDAAGFLELEECALGHRRLSIIDLAGGRQPMQTADGRYSMTFNGEIFNYVELREQLRSRGVEFRTSSDTEVLLQLFAEYGPACVNQLNGQWAFAVWDRDRRELFASRDRYGIRPFYFTQTTTRFSFASSIRALLCDPATPRTLDRKALAQVLTFWSALPPRTILDGIRELPPGHNLSFRDGIVELTPYWRPDYCPLDWTSRSFADLRDELRSVLVDATRLRLRSDVPVGAYLSGGLDSSITTALIRNFADADLQTFSVEFDDADFDESRFQRSVSAHLGTRHHSVRCRPDDIGRVFPEVVRHTERPILRTAPAPLFLLSELVQQHGIKVVMTGEGADEVFGGYDIFKEARVRRFWARQPESTQRPRLLEKLYPYMPALQKQPPAYLRQFFRADPADMANPFFSHLPRWELTQRIQQFLSPDVRQDLADYEPVTELAAGLPRDFDQWPQLCQAQYIEATTLLPGYILSSQGDRMAMAHSIEGRFPFLDHRVGDFAGRLPLSWKLCGTREKHLLKRAFEELLPAGITRRPKQPYRSPDIPAFFDVERGRARFDWVDELLSPAYVARRGVFDPRAVSRLAAKAAAGRASSIRDSMSLVGILSTQLVLDQLLEQPAAAESAPRPVVIRV